MRMKECDGPNNEVSWEEHRATLTKYQKPLVSNISTVASSADDKATGPVDSAVAES